MKYIFQILYGYIKSTMPNRPIRVWYSFEKTWKLRNAYFCQKLLFLCDYSVYPCKTESTNLAYAKTDKWQLHRARRFARQCYTRGCNDFATYRMHGNVWFEGVNYSYLSRHWAFYWQQFSWHFSSTLSAKNFVPTHNICSISQKHSSC